MLEVSIEKLRMSRSDHSLRFRRANPAPGPSLKRDDIAAGVSHDSNTFFLVV
jgi:hypothetical protein